MEVQNLTPVLIHVKSCFVPRLEREKPPPPPPPAPELPPAVPPALTWAPAAAPAAAAVPPAPAPRESSASHSYNNDNVSQYSSQYQTQAAESSAGALSTRQLEDDAENAAGQKLVIEGLKAIYRDVLKPIEAATKFEVFHSHLLSESEFDAAPMALLVGPYSVGKTSFIRNLLGQGFPGERVGPEPTTDRFHAIMHGAKEGSVPGNALSVAPGSPFQGLKVFGNAFMTRFEGAVVTAPVLEKLTLIDTPGVLAGDKQRLARSYDFEQIIKWFASRVDLIVLLFDPYKLDISDELARVILILKGNEDKIRVILNKADTLDIQILMRVYGALMWSLGKVFETPEVVRVYLGSFWEHPPKNPDTADLITAEMRDFMTDLQELPRSAALRKANELAKRMRVLTAHVYILHELRDAMPMMMGKAKKQQKLCQPEVMGEVFRSVHNKVGRPS